MDDSKVFVGLDDHQASVQVCVIEQRGEVLLNKSGPIDAGAIIAISAAPAWVIPPRRRTQERDARMEERDSNGFCPASQEALDNGQAIIEAAARRGGCRSSGAFRMPTSATGGRTLRRNAHVRHGGRTLRRLLQPPAIDRFVRFVTGIFDPKSGRPLGVFAACYSLLEGDDTDETMAAELRAYMDWFEEHLETPDRFSRYHCSGGRSRGEQGNAICWYRSTSQNFIRHMWTLVRILRDRGQADLGRRV